MAEKSGRAFLHPRYWLTWFGLAFLYALSWLPLPLLALLGSLLGSLLYVLHTPRRRIVRRNIERCFPELAPRAHRRLVRAHYRGLGQVLFDNAIAWWAPSFRLKRLARFHGREHFERAREAKRNIIFLAPHFLGLDVGGMRLSREIAMMSVFRHPDNALLAHAMERGRTRFGGLIFEHNKPFTALVRAVKGGTPLYYLPDQDAGRRNSVFAPFFGIPAATFITLGRLAKMTQAVVIPCVTVQRPWGCGYDVTFFPPLADYPSGDDLADATRMNQAIEAAVRRWPAQYFWVHKRFKTRPEGEQNFYR